MVLLIDVIMGVDNSDSLSLPPDCYMHHMMWSEHRVVLIVPVPSGATAKVCNVTLYVRMCVCFMLSIPVAQSDVTTRSRSTTGTGEGLGGGGGSTDAVTPTTERKRRRKPKIETLQEPNEGKMIMCELY